MEREEIVFQGEFPERMPEGIYIRFASKGSSISERDVLKDLSETGIQNMIKEVRAGNAHSLYLSSNPGGETDTRYLQMERKDEWIFVQICDDEIGVYYCSFQLEYLDSEEESPIQCSDGQSVILKKYTMHDLELALQCIEWFIRTGEPYPGMEWLKMVG